MTETRDIRIKRLVMGFGHHTGHRIADIAHRIGREHAPGCLR